jgi:hypothetical protein
MDVRLQGFREQAIELQQARSINRIFGSPEASIAGPTRTPAPATVSQAATVKAAAVSNGTAPARTSGGTEYLLTSSAAANSTSAPHAPGANGTLASVVPSAGM